MSWLIGLSYAARHLFRFYLFEKTFTTVYIHIFILNFKGENSAFVIAVRIHSNDKTNATECSKPARAIGEKLKCII
jgi:hypothetical protein